MKQRKILLLSSVLAIVLCLAIVVGATAAFFSADTSIFIPIQAGGMDLTAEVKDFELFSAAKTTETGENTFTDEKGNRYVYQSRGEKDTFASGGKAAIDAKTQSLSLNGLCAGDRVDFTVEVKNAGQIAALFNATLGLDKQKSNLLFNALDLKMSVVDGELPENGVSALSLAPFRSGTSAMKTSWIKLGKEAMTKLSVSLALPMSAGNTYQSLSTQIKISLSGVQDAGGNIGDAYVETASGDKFDYATLKDAVENAPEDSTVFVVRGDSRAEFENIAVSKSITIKSVNSDIKEFTDVHFVVSNGASLTIDNIALKGDSYIDVSTATELVMKNCEIDVAPTPLFDELTREYLPRAGFVVSDAIQQSGVKLDISNCAFAAADMNSEGAYTRTSAAIYTRGALGAGTKIADCTFGAEGAAYAASAVEILNAAARATLEIETNTFYCETVALSLSQTGNNAYYLRTARNLLNGNAKFAEFKENALVGIFDSGSKIGDRAIALSDFDTESMKLFAGVSVSYPTNTYEYVTGGHFRLADGMTEAAFEMTYVSGEARDGAVVFE